jgi:hypothetical protein
MKRVPPYVKPLSVVLGLIGLIVFLLIVEFGVNAGRIHYGVEVGEIDVGGLTLSEAEELLERRGDKLKTMPIVFGAEGFDCRFTPKEIGWGPQPFDTASAAMEIGRPLLSFDSIGERVDAWFTGIKLKWGQPDPERVERIVNDCERNSRGLNLTIDRERLRSYISEAIVADPRPPMFPVPLEE